jgi:hypothetical protein
MPCEPSGKDKPAKRLYAGVPEGRTTMITSKHLFIARALACLGAASASVGCGASDASVRQAEFVGVELPVVRVDVGSLSSSVPVSNAEAVVRTQIQPDVKRCYGKCLGIDASQSGTLVLVIKVAPDGRVDSVSAENNSVPCDMAMASDPSFTTPLPLRHRPWCVLSEPVERCTQSVAKRAMFEPPGDNGATITVPLNFSARGGAPWFSDWLEQG